MTTVAVCGGRHFGDIATLQKKFPLNYRTHPQWEIRQAQYDFVFRTLSLIAAEFSANYRQDRAWIPSDLRFVTGDATGADSVAVEWAISFNAPCEIYTANWKRYGKVAGCIRNQEILDKEKPDLLIAFPGRVGTQDMIDRARRNNIIVRQIDYQAARNINAITGI